MAPTPADSPPSSPRRSRQSIEAVGNLLQAFSTKSPKRLKTPSSPAKTSPTKSTLSKSERLKTPTKTSPTKPALSPFKRTRSKIKAIPSQLPSLLLLKQKYKESSETIDKMLDMFNLPKGTASFEQIMKALASTIDRNEQGREILRLSRKQLDTQLDNGTISSMVYRTRIRKLNRQHVQLVRQLQLLEQRRIIEEENEVKTSVLHEEGLLGALQRLIFFHPKGARSRSEQANMKAKTLEMYGLRAPETMKNHNELYWDVILGDYKSRNTMRCAHIVPRSFHNQVIDFVCGPSTSTELNTYKNALCIHQAVENALDQGHIVIMPADPSERPVTRFVVRLARAGTGHALIETLNGMMRVCDLDGRELQWRNHVRPKLRFLYFRWIHTLAITHMYHKDLLPPHFDELKTKEAWLTVGPWLRKGALLEMANIADCMNDEERIKILGTVDDEDKAVRARSLLTLIGHTIMGVPREEKDDEDDDGDDDYYEEEMDETTKAELRRKAAMDLFYDSELETLDEYNASIRGPVSDLEDE